MNHIWLCCAIVGLFALSQVPFASAGNINQQCMVWFDTVTLNGVVFPRSTELLPWFVAQGRCRQCFTNGSLADITSTLVHASLGTRLVFWVRSYDGGPETFGLSWWTSSGTVVPFQSVEIQARGLCNPPPPAPPPPAPVPGSNPGTVLTRPDICSFAEPLQVQGLNLSGSTIRFSQQRFASQWCVACYGNGLAFLNLSLPLNVDTRASGEYIITAAVPALRAFILNADDITSQIRPLSLEFDATPYKSLCIPTPPVLDNYPCDKFFNFPIGPNTSLLFPLSSNPIATWDAGYAACQLCFGTGLAEVTNEMIQSRFSILPGDQLFIGRYVFPNSVLTPNLVWSSTHDALFIAEDNFPRRFLCDGELES
jgi:hypothetical protein